MGRSGVAPHFRACQWCCYQFLSHGVLSRRLIRIIANEKRSFEVFVHIAFAQRTLRKTIVKGGTLPAIYKVKTIAPNTFEKVIISRIGTKLRRTEIGSAKVNGSEIKRIGVIVNCRIES